MVPPDVVWHRGKHGDNMKTIEIRSFSGGIKNDPRDPSANAARYLVNFDALTNSYKLSPRRDSESGDTAAATSQKQNFVIADRSGTYKLFSLGVISGLGRAEILMKDITQVNTNDLRNSGWDTPTNNQAASGTTSFALFTYYRYTTLANSRIFGASGGTRIWSFDPTSVQTFDDAGHNLTYTNIAEGLVHSKDDILYIPYDNKIAANNQGSWTDAAITLPSHLYITTICEKGNYLAIAAAPLSGLGGSKIYLWDRDTSLTTLSESIDAGEGVIKVMQELNGTLICISIVGNNDTRFTDRVVFKYYTGSGMETFYTLQGTTSTQLLSAKQRIDNRLLFQMQIMYVGAIRSGVWSVGHQGNNQFSVIHESTPNNNTAMLVGDNLRGFIKIGDFLFQSYQPSGVFALSKTNDTASYTATAYYETTMNEGMSPGDKVQKKMLSAVGSMYESFPTGGSCTVSYKVNSAAAWTAIYTETTTGVIFTEPFQNDAAGSKFTSGKEYEFQIKCTGGVEITGLIYKYSVLLSNALSGNPG